MSIFLNFVTLVYVPKSFNSTALQTTVIATKFSSNSLFFRTFTSVSTIIQYREFTQTDLCGLRSQSLKKVSVPSYLQLNSNFKTSMLSNSNVFLILCHQNYLRSFKIVCFLTIKNIFFSLCLMSKCHLNMALLNLLI